MKRRIWLWSLPVLALGLLIALPARSYLAEFTNSTNATNNVPDRWATMPVAYVVNTASAGANIQDQNTRSVQAVIAAAFATWNLAPNTSLSEVPTTTTIGTQPTTTENLIAFNCTNVNTCDFTKDVSTLAVTITNPNASTGVFQSANIFFNPVDAFTTDPTKATTTVQDLQTIATHEIGHFFGLDHTGVVRAMMYPSAPTVQLNLAYDDIAGISSIYFHSAGGFPTGKIQGQVFLNGAPVFGAHVFAESTTTIAGYTPICQQGITINCFRKSPISALTQPSGFYTITGLPVDSYTVTAEPLDLPVTGSDVDWGTEFGRTVQTNFTTRWH